MNQPFLIRIVDDDPLFCDAISCMLRVEGWDVASYQSAADFLRGDMPSRDGVLLLDISMPDMSGISLHRELIARGYRQPIIFLTAHATVDIAVDAMRRGAFHFLQKPVEPDKLVKAINLSLEYISDRSKSMEDISSVRNRLDSLTGREREVAEMLSSGLLNTEIAAALHLSVRTVELYHAHIYTKLGVKSVADVSRMLALCKVASSGESAKYAI